MAMGFNQRPRGLFGVPGMSERPPGWTPGINPEPQHAYAQAPQEAPRQGGGFDHKRVIGILGDAMLGFAGQGGIYGPMMHQRRMLEDRDRVLTQQRQQERQWGNEDWIARQQYEAANPKPRTNDTIEDFNWYKGLSPEDRGIYDQMRPTYRQGPDGQFYRVETQQAPQVLGSELPQGWTIEGGAAPAGTPPFASSRYVPPQRLTHGSMTSGRRTQEGNRIVRGVPNSGHLRGTDADYDGPDLNALLEEVRQLPGHRKSFIHDGHVHSSGDWDVPYFGRRGTTGLRGR